ncbi:BON domain-containing protein [Bythopirellula goksoeyrii]|uniref:BON domain protein n=1 Tax=Bythopirellula goksoeyrii TaxID=1400387 RepID=A0A5B9QH45_9BACT|nr:BON domain-containing protein [Bythopirellula goksoeyrii]QEG36932.1 BON domain protein [Bythopirellula goksoeyrii]
MTTDIRVTYEPTVLAEKVKNSIDKLGYPELKNIRCRAHQSDIHLQGHLASYYLKQVVQTIAIKVPGVHKVINDIEVSFPKPESTSHQR